MESTKKARKQTANGNGGSKWITKKRRLALALRDRFTCIYCLRDLHDADPRDITLDHIICRSGGKADHSSKNLVLCCRSCNSRRQDLPLSRFCGPETRAHIRRNTRRSMAKYLRLAQAILDGKTGEDAEPPNKERA